MSRCCCTASAIEPMHRYGPDHHNREIVRVWLEEHHSVSAAFRSARGRSLGDVAMSTIPRLVSELLPRECQRLGAPTMGMTSSDSRVEIIFEIARGCIW